MNKKTINAILTVVNVVLVIAIILLIVRIGMREPLDETVENTSASDNTVLEEDTYIPEESQELEDSPKEIVLVAVPQTTSSVNVRSGPGVEFDRIGSAYSDCEYVVIECYENGWTKLDYDGNEGYISSEYLKYRYRETVSDGSYSYMDVDTSEIELVQTPDMQPPAVVSDNSTEEPEVQGQE